MARSQTVARIGITTLLFIGWAALPGNGGAAHAQSGPAIVNTSLGNALVGRSYRTVLAATGASSPHWTITAGDFEGSGPFTGRPGTPCAGLTLTPESGDLSGGPWQHGVCGPFTVTVTDLSTGTAVSREFTVKVVPNLLVVTDGSTHVARVTADWPADPYDTPTLDRPVSSVVMAPDGSYAYLYAASGGDALVVLDHVTGRQLAAALIENPVAVAPTPDGTRVLVAAAPSGTPGALHVVETAGFTTVGTAPLPSSPLAIAVSPDSRTAYVTTQADQLLAIDLTALIIDSIGVGADPRALAVSPGGHTVYVASSTGLALVDAQALAVTQTIAFTPQQGASLTIGDLELSADGRFAYVSATDGLRAVDVHHRWESAWRSVTDFGGEEGDPPAAIAAGSDDHMRLLVMIPGSTAIYQLGPDLLGGTVIASPTTGVDLGASPNPMLRLATQSLPDVPEGHGYSAAIVARGGTAPYAFALASGELPAGLALEPSGTIVGVPTAEGEYAFIVTVSDAATPSVSVVGTVVLRVDPSTPPQPDIAIQPADPYTGQVVTFDASASFDPDSADHIVSYQWDLDLDGTTDATGAIAQRTFENPGLQGVGLTLTDSFGVSATTEAWFDVLQNHPPEFQGWSASPDPALVGRMVTFSADVVDQDGHAVTIAWDFGDGTSAAGGTVAHAYAATGSYGVTVTATDSIGVATTAFLSIEVQESAPPVAAIVMSASATAAGIPVLVDGSASYEPNEGLGDAIVAYEWTFGDGSTASGAVASHSYLTPGAYLITLTVTDTTGLTGTAAVDIVVTANSAPVATFTASPNPAVPGVPVTFDATGSSDPDEPGGDVLSYRWDLDSDGTIDIETSSPVVTHTFTAVGPRRVTLSVADLAGNVGQAWLDLDLRFGIVNAALRNGLVGHGYHYELAAGGQAAPVTWSVTSGPFTLPVGGAYEGGAGTACEGLSLTTQGTLSGTPVRPGQCGPFTVEAADGTTTASRTYEMHVLPAVAYVANNGANSVSVIDPAAAVEAATIATPERPGAIVVHPDGTRAYVTLPGDITNVLEVILQDGGSQVAVIDTTRQELLSTIVVGQRPTSLVTSPDGRYVYVANTRDRTVSVIDARTDAVTSTIAVGSYPIGLAVSPDGRTLYVGQPTAGRIVTIDLTSESQSGEVLLEGAQVVALALSPDGRRLLAAALNRDTTFVVDTESMTVTGTVSTGPARGLGLTPDGRFGFAAAHPVVVMDLNGLSRGPSIDVGGEPFGVAVTPDGQRALVTDFQESVHVVDVPTREVIGSVATGPGAVPAGVAALPHPTLHLATTVLPPGLAGMPYGFCVAAAGGLPPYTFTAGAGLPAGLALDAAGCLSGTPEATGTFSFPVTVVDRELPAQSMTAVVSLSVAANRPPEASFLFSPSPAAVGDPVTFDASASRDPDEDAGDAIVSFTWDFGDGTVVQSSDDPEQWYWQVQHQYATTGAFTVRLTLTDRTGATDTATRTVQVNEIRIAGFDAAPNPTVAGAPVFFDALSQGNDEYAFTFAWDFETDGTWDAEGPYAQHGFPIAGAYLVTLRAIDAGGRTGLVTQTVVVIANRPPTAAFSSTPASAIAGLPVSFDASASSDPDGDAGDALVFAWDFGDGQAGAGQWAEHFYAAPGDYTATLTVTDRAGATSSASATISVAANAAPIAVLSATPNPAPPGVPVTLDASGSYDPQAVGGDLIAGYDWDLDGDGTYEVIGGEPVVMRTVDAVGDYVVSVRVADLSGQSATASVTLAVRFGVVNQSLPNGLVGHGYEQRLATAGGTEPVQWLVSTGPFDDAGGGTFAGRAGTACQGLSLDAQGRLSGTPDVAGVCGPFTVQASDGGEPTQRTLHVRVQPAHAYVANNGDRTLSVLDTVSRRVTATVALPAEPGGVAVAPDGERAYVTLPGPITYVGTMPVVASGDGLAVVDTTTHEVTTTIAVGQGPTRVAVSPDSRRVFVLNSLSSTISAVDAATGSILATESAGSRPMALAVTPDGRFVLVGSLAGLRVLDAGNLTEHYRQAVGGGVTALALANDGDTLFSAIFANGNAWLAAKSLESLLSGTEGDSPSSWTAQLGDAFPIDAQVSPNGRWVYVSTRSGLRIVDTWSRQAIDEQALASLFGVAFLPEHGASALLSQSPSSVLFFDPLTRLVDATVAAGSEPASVAAMPLHALHVTTQDVRPALNGVPYSARLAAAGGAWPHQFLLAGGVLPAGLSLDANGQLAGTPTVDGTFTFDVEVTDASLPAQSRRRTVTLTVRANAPPHARIDALPVALANEPFYLDARASSDPDADLGDRIAGYEWDYEDDGTFVPGDAQTWTTFGSPGDHTVTLRVTDSLGQTATASIVIAVGEFELGPPDAQPNPVVAGMEVHFDALAGNNGASLLYDWDFDRDGAFDDATGVAATHRFMTPGSWLVTLRGTDAVSGTRGYSYVSVEVLPNGAPVAAIDSRGPAAVVGAPMLFSATGSSDPDEGVGDVIVRYDWTFGDGTATSTETPEVSHAYAAVGSYAVTLTVTDAGGNASSASLAIAVVENHAPLAAFTIGSSPVVAGVPVRLDATSSADPDAAAGDGVVLHEWDLDNDGAFDDATGAVVTHVFASTGDHVVALRVTDRGGLIATASQTVSATFGIVTVTLRNALVNHAYHFTLAAGEAGTTATWSVLNGPFGTDGTGTFHGAPGSPCEGLRLLPGGSVTGTPTRVGQCGPFDVRAAHGDDEAARTFSITVVPEHVYVAGNDAQSVAVIDAATRAVVGTIPVPGHPGGVASSPDGERLYVTLPGPATWVDGLPSIGEPVGNTLVVIDTTSRQIVASVEVGAAPVGVAASADGRWVYTANAAGGSLSAIDTSTWSVAFTVADLGSPAGVALSQGGRVAFVAESNGVAVVDLDTRVVVERMTLGAGPLGVTLSPDGRRLYASEFGHARVSVIDVAQWAVVDEFPTTGAPRDAAVSPDGRHVLVAASDGVLDIDTSARAIASTAAPAEPHVGVAFDADGTDAFVSTSGAGVTTLRVTTPTGVGSIAVAGTLLGIATVPNPILHIASEVMPAGEPGQPYAFALTAAGGVPPYRFTVTAGALPPGLVLDGDVVTGTPTATGSYTFTVEASDADLPSQRATRTILLRVGALTPASIVLSGLSHTYDGTPKSAIATTSPEGLAVDITYNGDATAPTTAGTYVVAAVLADGGYEAAPASGLLVIARATQSIAFDPLPAGLSYGDVVPIAATASSGLPVTLVASGACAASGATVTLSSVGECVVTASQTGNVNHHAAQEVTRSTIAVPRSVTVTAHAQSKSLGEADPPLTYTVTSGTLVPGDAFTGSLTRSPGESAGTYDITRGSLDLGPNYQITFVGATLTVTPRTALPAGTPGAYAGETGAWTSGADTSAAVWLAAAIRDAAGVGRISEATVSFAVRLPDGSLSPIPGATGLTVVPDAIDPALGRAGVLVTLSLTGSGTCSVYPVVVQVGGGYTMQVTPDQDAIVTVCRQTPSSTLANPAATLDGSLAGGPIAGDSTSSFNVRYGRNGSSPVGEARIAIRSQLLASTGLPDPTGAIHAYVISVAALANASVKGTKVSMSGKATVIELVTGTDGRVTATTLDSGASAQITCTDNGAAGDTLAVHVSRGKRLWFSSRMNGGKTVESTILAGDIIVTP